MEKMTVLIIFLAAYLLFIFFHRLKHFVAFGGCLLFVLLRIVGIDEVISFVDWNIIGVFVGTLIVADVFMRSGAPEFLAGILVSKIKNTALSVLSLCFLAGVLSIALENVATVLIIAPIAFALAEKVNIKPVALLIGIAISSNLQGAATLIGDPPSMLLAAYARLTFNDFFFFEGRPSIFFAMQLAAVGSLFVLYLFFRKHSRKVDIEFKDKVRNWTPTLFLIALVASLVIASVIDPEFNYLAGWLCIIIAVVASIWELLKYKSSFKETLMSFDWQSTLFLICIFVLVGTLVKMGWMENLSNFISSLLGENVFLTFVMLISFSVLISAFVDNVPYLAAMLPVAQSLAARLEIHQVLFMFALLIGACLGGNITPIGASANIVACGQLKQKGYDVSFSDFVKIGLPFTLISVFLGSLLIWFIWG